MKKILFVISFVLLLCEMSLGQETSWRFRTAPNRLDWWIGGTLGSTLSFADNAAGNNFKMNFPSVDIQGGTFFTRSLGARLVGGLSTQTGQADDETIKLYPEKYDTHYRFFLLTLNADAMVNLSTLFLSPNHRRPKIEVMVFAGGGVVESFHFDTKLKDWNEYPIDYLDKTVWTARAGLMGTVRISPHWDWAIETSYNLIGNRYDGVNEKSAPSGFMKFQTGFIYHLYNRNSRMVKLPTQLDSDWAPKYNEKDREKVRKEERERIEKARKEYAKQSKEKAKKIEKHNEEVKEKNKQFKKDKEKRAKQWEEAKLYNELVF